MKVQKVWNRWKVQVLCVVGGFLLYGAAVSGGSLPDGVSGGYLERGDYGEGVTTYDFYVKGLAEEPVACQAEIPARQYTDAEAARVFGGILSALPQEILGDNDSLSRVEDNLVLPVSFENDSITAEWYSDAPEILDSYGEVRTEGCPAEGAAVWLRVELSDGVHHAERSYAVTVYPKTLTEQERLAAALADEIREADVQAPAEPAVKLPETFEGRNLRYYQEEADYRFIPVLGILLAMFFYAHDRNRETEERKKREQKLLLDYADVVYQLMVFTGAGLTVSRAWERIVRNYAERRRDGRVPERPAYEEMADAQAQMECGVPEGRAIIQFGQRCRLQPYRRLSGLLEQNRRTGTKDLMRLMEQEMASAWEQQKTTARRLGEEAGTKLLLPLVLLLLVVMVIIMVPAMMSM